MMKFLPHLLVDLLLRQMLFLIVGLYRLYHMFHRVLHFALQFKHPVRLFKLKIRVGFHSYIAGACLISHELLVVNFFHRGFLVMWWQERADPLYKRLLSCHLASVSIFARKQENSVSRDRRKFRAFVLPHFVIPLLSIFSCHCFVPIAMCKD